MGWAPENLLFFLYQRGGGIKNEGRREKRPKSLYEEKHVYVKFLPYRV